MEAERRRSATRRLLGRALPRGRLGSLAAGAVVLAVAGLEPRLVTAEPCDDTPAAVLETFPASGARDAPRNGVVVVLYCPPEDPLVDRSAARLLWDLGLALPGCDCPGGGECLRVGVVDHCLEGVPTRTTVDGERVVLETEDGDLLAGTTYVIEAPEPAGWARVSFTTGTETDQSPPAFSGPTDIRIIGCGQGYPSSAACGDAEEGLVVVLSAPAANDEAGRVNLEYVALQVRDDRLVERGRARGDGAADVTMSVLVPEAAVEDADDQICFRMAARDPYGHESRPDAEVCEHTPDYSPFGSLCALTPARPSGPSLALAALVAALVLALRRARR